MKQLFFKVLFCLTSFLFISCAVTLTPDPYTTNVSVEIPAQYPIDAGESIAVMNITGFMGDDLADELEAKLWESRQFKVLERQEIQELMIEKQMRYSSDPNSEELVEIGELLGASVMIFGRIKNDTTFYNDLYNTVNYAQLDMSFRIVDVETGEILFVKQYSETSQNRLVRTSGDEGVVSFLPNKFLKTTTFKECRTLIIDKIIKTIAPYSHNYSLTFFMDNEIPDLESGVSLVKTKEYTKAMGYFQRAVELNPRSWKANYDYALGFETLKKFDDAVKYYVRAQAIYFNNDNLNVLTSFLFIEDTSSQATITPDFVERISWCREMKYYSTQGK